MSLFESYRKKKEEKNQYQSLRNSVIYSGIAFDTYVLNNTSLYPSSLFVTTDRDQVSVFGKTEACLDACLYYIATVEKQGPATSTLNERIGQVTQKIILGINEQFRLVPLDAMRDFIDSSLIWFAKAMSNLSKFYSGIMNQDSNTEYRDALAASVALTIMNQLDIEATQQRSGEMKKNLMPFIDAAIAFAPVLIRE